MKSMKDRIEKLDGKIYIKLYPHEVNETFQFSNNKMKITFSVEGDIPNIELSENVIYSDFYLLFEYIKDEKIDDETLKLYIKPVDEINFTEYNFGCVVIKNVSYKDIHLGCIKERKNVLDVSNHDFRYINSKLVCKNCGLEVKVKEIMYIPIDDEAHKKVYILENGEKITEEEEPHGKNCFMKCFAEETKEIINILKDATIQDDYLIHPKMKVKLNKKRRYIGTQLDTYGDRFESVSKITYNPMLVDGDGETYERMVYLLTKLRNILIHVDEYSKYVIIFTGKCITVED